jgi:catalase
MRFVRDAYRHGKPIGALGSGVGILSSLEPEGLRLSTEFHRVEADRGVVTETSPGPAVEEFLDAFVAAIASHRHWDRLPTRH